jgi:hypothetical protein
VGEEQLPGGHVTAVVRIGDTVRRAPPRGADFVHALLGLLAERGWAGAPRSLDMDEQGRQTLSYLAGHVAWAPDQPPDVTCDASLGRAAALIREFHDLTAGTRLAAGQEVVCHNDLSPRNTVYRDAGDGLRPVAFIDWDIAAPGSRLHDMAHACWQYAGLGPGADPDEAARRIRVICDGYGLADTGRASLLETILWWQDRCWRGIEAKAETGDPAMIRLRDSGGARSVRAAYDWVAAHRRELSVHLA